MSAHTNGEEMSNNLAMNVGKALRQYVSIHKVLPSRILFYRDGVGDGQVSSFYIKMIKITISDIFFFLLLFLIAQLCIRA